jgi:polysaccharide export outer membrane protein
MRNQDIVFIANSVSVDVTKFLNYLNVIMATTNNGIILGTNSIILRNSIRALKGT